MELELVRIDGSYRTIKWPYNITLYAWVLSKDPRKILIFSGNIVGFFSSIKDAKSELIKFAEKEKMLIKRKWRKA